MEFDNDTLRQAVNIYVEDEIEGERLYGHINTWLVSNVTNMSYMFYDAQQFNQQLNNWNVSNVTNMSYMFYGAYQFNQPLNSWNVKNALEIMGMFHGAKQFNQPINSWNVNNVTDMSFMFHGTKINKVLSNYNLNDVQFFDNTINQQVLRELFPWLYKKDYIMFLVNNGFFAI